MANVLYPKGKEAILGGDADWDSHEFRAALIGNSGAYNSAHQYRDDLADVIATSGVAITGKSKTGGAAGASNMSVAFATVATNAKAIVVYRVVGSAATDLLIAWIDTASGLPHTQNGGDVGITWNSGVVFSL